MGPDAPTDAPPEPVVSFCACFAREAFFVACGALSRPLLTRQPHALSVATDSMGDLICPCSLAEQGAPRM